VLLLEFKLFYDGDCPVCRNYATYQALTKTFHKVDLINLRELNSEQLDGLKKHANPNEGLIVQITDGNISTVLQGAAALHYISVLTESSNKKFSLWRTLDRLMRKEKIAQKLYPFLFWLRLRLLKILRINPKFD
jgi:predicted DCC family thiol-disulfide oxidoreductase YuxK